MFILPILVVFLLGIAIGSFFNAFVWRFPREERITAKHSVCVRCGHELAPKDLVPLLSFAALGGHCRYCHKPISIRYPIIELATGLLLLFPLAIYGFTWAFAAIACLALLLELLFLLDLFYSILPDNVTIPAFVVAVLVSLVLQRTIGSMLIGSAIGAGFFGAQYLFSHGKWIGSGDIRLGAVMGIALGTKLVLTALFLSYCTGALVSLLLILLKRKGWNSQVPFGTFLAASAYILLLWGAPVGRWLAENYAFVRLRV